MKDRKKNNDHDSKILQSNLGQSILISGLILETLTFIEDFCRVRLRFCAARAITSCSNWSAITRRPWTTSSTSPTSPEQFQETTLNNECTCAKHFLYPTARDIQWDCGCYSLYHLDIILSLTIRSIYGQNKYAIYCREVIHELCLTCIEWRKILWNDRALSLPVSLL